MISSLLKNPTRRYFEQILKPSLSDAKRAFSTRDCELSSAKAQAKIGQKTPKGGFSTDC